MDLEELIKSYGYLALFVGTLLEGETILIIAGAIAKSTSLLNIYYAIPVAFLGSYAGDQIVFYIARHHGKWLLSKKPQWKPKIDKVSAILEKHSTWLLLSFRFFYGLRNFTSIGIGLSKISAARFALLNGIGAAVWAIAFGLGGYLLGHALEAFIEDLHEYMLHVWGGVLIFLALLWILKVVRNHFAALRDLKRQQMSNDSQQGQENKNVAASSADEKK